MSDLATMARALAPDRRRLVEILLRKEGFDISRLPIPARARDGALQPTSFAQERLWFVAQLDPGSPAYNLRLSLRATGALDVEHLRRAFDEVQRRHESLRTTFCEQDGRPMQRIAEPALWPLPLVDLTALAGEPAQAEAQRLAREEALRPFDLERGPLLRTCLLRLGERSHFLLWMMHHIISDAWSVAVFTGEVTTLYRAYRAGEGSPLPELLIQHADFAAWQRRLLSHDFLQSHLAYWRRQLDAAPVLELTTDFQRPAVPSSRGAEHWFSLPREVCAGARALARREDATLFMVLLAGLQLLLARYTGQEDVVVGAHIASRNHPGMENLIGFFVNNLVLRTDLAGDPTCSELVQRVCEVCLGAFAHQDLPFEMLVQELRPERDASRTPFFQVMLVLQNAPPESLYLEELELRPLAVEGSIAKFDLTLFVFEQGEGISACWEYNTDLFTAATVHRLAERFTKVLRELAGDPGRHISTIGFGGEPGEAHMLLDAFRGEL